MKLFKWQEEAIEFSSTLKSSYWFVNGGGGKTFAAYNFAMEYSEFPIYVIAPPRLKKQWEKTFKDLEFNFISTGKLNKKEYELPNEKEFILFFDECDNGISKTSTNTFKNLSKLVKKSFRYVGLSATMLDEIKWENTFPLLKLAEPKYLKKTFDAKYIKHGTKKLYTASGIKEIKVIESYQNIPELLEEFEAFTYFNTFEREETWEDHDDDVLEGFMISLDGYNQNEITGKVFVKKFNNELPQVIKQMKSTSMLNNQPIFKKEQKYHIAKNLISGIENIIAPKLTNDFKIKHLKELWTNNEHKALCFYNTNAEYEILKEHFEDHYFLKDDDLENFKGADDGILFCQYQSGSRGLDFQDLYVIYWFSPTERYKDYKQAKVRVGRSGSLFNTVYEYHMILENSLDEDIWNRLWKKENYDYKKEF